jgi:uncharacterized membrane protein
MNTRIPVTLLALLAGAGAAIAQPYTLVDLGTLSGESHAFALAPHSGTGALVVVGSSTGPEAHFSAVRFAPAIVEIPTLPGFNESVAFAASPDGSVFGVAYSFGDPICRAFVDIGAGPLDLGAFTPRAANSAGQIAGATTVVTSTFGGLTLPRAARWHDGTLDVLPTLGGSSSLGLAIDDAGRVAGSSFNTADAASRPCLWIGSTPSDLGTLGGTSGQVYALYSDNAVGVSTNAAGLFRATLWRLSPQGTVLSRLDLGGLTPATPSAAHAMNTAGDVVGTSGFRAVLWRAGAAIDLNTFVSEPGWVLETAWDIDDAGRIVGSGTLWGAGRAFMLDVAGPACSSDFNHDGTVNSTDVSDFINQWFRDQVEGTLLSDWDANGIVNSTDVSEFINSWFEDIAAGCG